MKISFNIYAALLVASIVMRVSQGQAQPIISDYNTHTDFSKYKTYAWMAPGDSVLNGRRTDKVFGGYIMYAANEELKKKGMTIDLVKPDAVFILNTSVKQKTEYSQSPTLSVGVGVAGPGYYVEGSAPVAGGEITEKTMTDGILEFNMYDTKTGSLIWSGSVEKTFSTYADDVEALIGEYTKKIFKKLPVKNK